jgi:hypothetical protein
VVLATGLAWVETCSSGRECTTCLTQAQPHVTCMSLAAYACVPVLQIRKLRALQRASALFDRIATLPRQVSRPEGRGSCHHLALINTYMQQQWLAKHLLQAV